MNSNIFNIQAEYLAIVDELELNGGEVTPELEETLAINAEERDAKMLAYIHVIKQLQGDNAMIKDEIARLRDKAESNDKVANKLKRVLMEAMERYELYGKTGNLSHKVGSYTMFSRETEAVEFNFTELSREDEQRFEDLINVMVALNGEDYHTILNILKDKDINLYERVTENHESNISKTTFKTAYETAKVYEEGANEKVMLNALSEIGEIVKNKSLTIR